MENNRLASYNNTLFLELCGEDSMGKDGWSKEELNLREKVLSGEAIAVNIRKKGPHVHLVEWSRSAGLFVYVGRAVPWRGYTKSLWHNPFYGEDRNVLLQKYDKYLQNRKDLIESMILLKGRVLGCWCKPLPCHADILVRFVNSY